MCYTFILIPSLSKAKDACVNMGRKILAVQLGDGGVCQGGGLGCSIIDPGTRSKVPKMKITKGAELLGIVS